MLGSGYIGHLASRSAERNGYSPNADTPNASDTEL
jgi:hypothetical protein